MEGYETKRTLLGTVLTWIVAIVAVVIGLKLVFWLLAVVTKLLGTVFGIIAFVVFTVVPILIVGWIVMKLFGYVRRRQTI